MDHAEVLGKLAQDAAALAQSTDKLAQDSGRLAAEAGAVHSAYVDRCRNYVALCKRLPVLEVAVGDLVLPTLEYRLLRGEVMTVELTVRRLVSALKYRETYVVTAQGASPAEALNDACRNANADLDNAVQEVPARALVKRHPGAHLVFVHDGAGVRCHFYNQPSPCGTGFTPAQAFAGLLQQLGEAPKPSGWGSFFY